MLGVVLVMLASLHPALSYTVVSPDTAQFPLVMPGARPTQPHSYLCTTLRLDPNTTHWITGFQPQAEMGTAHHMLLFGCKQPGQLEPLFSCGEMGRKEKGTKLAAPCQTGQQIIYAWARDAPALQLPPGVGFRVGGPEERGIQYLVLQVHYASTASINATTGDTSGVVLNYTAAPQPKLAGTYFLGTGGMIPGGSTTHMESACRLNTKLTIHPFAFRTHTHALGRVVSGWKVSPDMQWTLLGKRDPQLPQMFYPTEPGITVTGGDTLAARCTMVSYRDRTTWVGATSDDEMCNFYLMYWVEGKEKLRVERCVSLGPPVFTWDRWLVGGGLSNIPHEAASSLV